MSNSWIDNNVKNFGVAPSIKSDLLANLPSTAAIGSLFVSTDTFAWYRFNGTGWDLIGGAGVGDITGGGTVGELAKFTGARVIGDAVAGVDYVKPNALNGYVPYTGAIGNVNIGAFNLEGTNLIANGQLIFGGSTTTDQYVRSFNSASTGRKGLNLSDGLTVDMKIYTGGNQTLGNFTESDRTMVIGTGYQGGGGSLENILFHSTGIGNLFALSVPQNRAFMYLPMTVSSELVVGGDLKFSGSSGGLNLMYYSSNRFYLLSYFDTITIQGGVNDANKRQIDFNTGASLSAYIDINGVFWKGSTSTAIADSDNSLKFATTSFVKNNLSGFVPYTGATANVDLGSNEITAIRGFFGGGVFLRGTQPNLYLGSALGTSPNVPTVFQYSANGNRYFSFNVNNTGYYSMVDGLSAIERFTITQNGNIAANAEGVPITLNSRNSNAFKISLQDAGTTRGNIGADSSNCFLVGDNAATTIISVNNSTGVSSFSLKSGQNGNVVRLSRSAGAYTWGIGVSSNSEYIVTNNSNVTLFSINPNTGRNFAVGGITYSNGTHGIKTLAYDAATSIVIDLPTEFPEMFLTSGNTWAVFGRCNLFSSTGQVEVREFYIGRNTVGTWAAAAYSTNSTTGASLQSVTGSGSAITVNMNAGTYLQVELTVMVR